ncbi:MAG: arginine repressor [Chloroflexi bacterium]|nr:arginine repressor [Chloroflexota bacterium]
MKQLRHGAIRDLLAQRDVRTQQELAAALRERGFRATQATISRDVGELGLVKVHRHGLHVYALPPRVAEPEPSAEERLGNLLRALPVDVRESGLMLVVRTLSGSAHAIAAALDRAHWPEIVGSIAGDDTLFVACTDRTSLHRARRRLLRMMEPPEPPQPRRRRAGSGRPPARAGRAPARRDASL